jgi:hypothetical protein
MKISVPRVKPRNPLVPAAAKRKAGKHEKGASSQRQKASRELDKEVIQAVKGRGGKGGRS